MNKLKKINLLFISSIGMVLGNFFYIIISNKLLKYYYILGLSTSLLNHGTSNLIIFRYIDRLTMFIGVFVDYYNITNYHDLLLLIIIISCYFYSKLNININYHITAHFLITILHNNLLQN